MGSDVKSTVGLHHGAIMFILVVAIKQWQQSWLIPHIDAAAFFLEIYVEGV